MINQIKQMDDEMKKEQSDEEIYLNPKTSLNKKLEIMNKKVYISFVNASR